MFEKASTKEVCEYSFFFFLPDNGSVASRRIKAEKK